MKAAKKVIKHDSFGFAPVIKKFTKPEFKKWFLKRFPDEEKVWEKHYEKLHAPAKEEKK